MENESMHKINIFNVLDKNSVNCTNTCQLKSTLHLTYVLFSTLKA